MRKLLLIGTVCALAATVQAVPLNLGSLIANNGTITIGDKIFGDFGFQSAAFVDANNATVDAYIENGVYYLAFQGPWTVQNGASADIGLSYTVATTSGQPLISMIDQSFTLTAAGTGGTIAIGETVRIGGFGGTTVAQSTVAFVTGLITDLEDPVAEPLTGDDLYVNPAQSKLWVTKDIFMQANVGGLVGPTVVRQSFHQVGVPDGGLTACLLGLGMLAISGFRRFTKRD